MSVDAPLRLLLPPGFRPAGPIATAEPLSVPPVAADFAPQPARFARGLRFESQAKRAIDAWAGSRKGVTAEPGPWFRFRAATGAWRFCQPDMLIDSGADRPLLLLEIKLACEARAWFQLQQLYRPVVETALGRPARIGAVFGSFDPAVRSRLPVAVSPDLGSAAAWLDWMAGLAGNAPAPESSVFPVLQWRNPAKGAC